MLKLSESLLLISSMLEKENKPTLAHDVESAVERIAELEDLAQMIIDAESADLRVLPLMYQAWLHKAKALQEKGE